MSLMIIKAYFIQHRVASLQTLCQLFAKDAETMRCLLQHFLNKGQLKCCRRQVACGSACFKCPVEATELYEWQSI